MNVVSYDAFRQKLEAAEREMIAATTELPLSADDIDRLQLLFVARVMQMIGNFDFSMATTLQHEGDVAAAREVEKRILGTCLIITQTAARKVAAAIRQARQVKPVQSGAASPADTA